MNAALRLRRFALAVLVLNVVATVVAVVVNLPSQFGRVGTDAGSEFLTSGTAISAPLLPVVLLIAVAALADRAGQTDRFIRRIRAPCRLAAVAPAALAATEA